MSDNTEAKADTALNTFLFVNLASYVFNVFVTFGIGTFGLFGRPDNGTLSDKYQTILTPSGSAFSIWGIIFIAQAIWVVVQWWPSFRNSRFVRNIGFGYAFVCLMQAGWTVSFSFEIQWLAYIFMVAINLGLNYCVRQMQRTEKSIAQYFLWQFPFSLHCGWIFAATALNTNVLAVAYNGSRMVQIVVAAACLVILLGVAMTWLSSYPVDLTIPLVLVWALGWIYAELQAPRESIVQRFEARDIEAFGYAALAGAGTILVLTSIKIVYVCVVQRPRAKPGGEALPR